MLCCLCIVFVKYWVCWLLVLLLIGLVEVVVVGVLFNCVVECMDLFFYDLCMCVVKLVLDLCIVIVDIDECSINELGCWFWSCDLVVKLVEQMMQVYQVQLVGFDVVFVEFDIIFGYGCLEDLVCGLLKDVL